MISSNSHTTVDLSGLPGAALSPVGPEIPSHKQQVTTDLSNEPDQHEAEFIPPDNAIFRALFEGAHNPMGIVEIVNDSIVHVADNAASGRLFERDPASMCNKPASEVGISLDAVQKWLHYYRRSQRTGQPQRFDYKHQAPEREAVVLVTVTFMGLSADGWPRFSYVTEDVTERRRSQNALHGEARQYRDLYAAAQRREQELALQDKVRTALMHELDTSSVIRTVVEGIAGTMGYTHVSIYMVKESMLELQHQVGYDDVIAHLPLGRGIAGQVASTGEPVFLEEVSTSPIFVAPIEGVVSEICVPLFDGDVVAGILNVESVGGVKLIADDLRVITALGEFISIALGRARLYAGMKDSEARFQAFMNNSPALAFIKDEESRFVYMNEPYERTFAIRARDLIGKTDSRLPEPMLRELKEHDEAVLSQEETVEAIHTIPTPDGVPHDWLVYKFPLKDASGRRLVGCVAIDITERRQAEQAMHQLAIRDELTGLYNRREMRRLLEEAAERYASHGQPAALLMLDIDHFKLVNDNYGHRAGDSVLQSLSEFIHERISPAHVLARYGGEELAVILPDMTENEALDVAEHIRVEIEGNPFILARGNGQPAKIQLTVSLGVAAYSNQIDSEEALVAAADIALYEAKRRGRNCAVLFDTQVLKTTAFLTTQVLQGP